MEEKPELAPEEESGERVVVTPSGRLTKEAVPPDTDVLTDPEAIPVTYEEAPGDEIDPALLEQYYEMVRQQQLYGTMARPRRFVAKSVTTKKQHDKAKRNSRNKMAKKSRKKNRKK